MTIDWDAIRAKGEHGALTADEVEALVKLAKDGIAFGGDGMFSSEYCWTACLWDGGKWRHDDDCPIAVLESVTDDWRDNA